MPVRLARALRTVPIAAVAAMTLALAGCGSGMHPATLDDAPLDARSANVGEIAIRGAIVVAPEDGGGSPVFVATIVNQGSSEDALTGVTFSTPDGDIAGVLKPTTISLSGTTMIPNGTRPMITVDGDLTIGSYVTAKLAFADAGSVSMTLLVVAPSGPYADYTAS